VHSGKKAAVLLLNTVLYRVLIVGVQIAFFGIITKDWRWATNVSIVWNIINSVWYYAYNYIFFSFYKMER
jgi:uncharacterized membrane protein